MADSATLRSVLDDDYALLRGLRPKALSQFRLSLQRYREHLGHEPTIEDLTGVAVQRFLSARKSKVSAATALKDRTHIAALWNHLFRLRRVDVAPAAVLPPLRAPRRVPRAYRDHEVAAILRAALATPGGVDGRPASIWHASLIRAAFETAERVGALLLVEWRDVDLHERTILLRAENRKGSHQDLLRPISIETARWLGDLRRDAGDRRLVWRWDRVPTHLWGHFRGICKRDPGHASRIPRVAPSSRVLHRRSRRARRSRRRAGARESVYNSGSLCRPDHRQAGSQPPRHASAPRPRTRTLDPPRRRPRIRSTGWPAGWSRHCRPRRTVPATGPNRRPGGGRGHRPGDGGPLPPRAHRGLVGGAGRRPLTVLVKGRASGEAAGKGRKPTAYNPPPGS